MSSSLYFQSQFILYRQAHALMQTVRMSRKHHQHNNGTITYHVHKEYPLIIFPLKLPIPFSLQAAHIISMHSPLKQALSSPFPLIDKHADRPTTVIRLPHVLRGNYKVSTLLANSSQKPGTTEALHASEVTLELKTLMYACMRE